MTKTGNLPNCELSCTGASQIKNKRAKKREVSRLCWRTKKKKANEHESNGDINYNWCSCHGYERGK